MFDRMLNLNAPLESMETAHLLMIACGTNQAVHGELRDMFKELFSILKQKKAKKIMTAQSDDSTADFMQQRATETVGEGFITTDGQLAWSDLIASSQTAILGKTVILQGKPVALSQLTSAESLTSSFSLADLLHKIIGRVGVPCAGS